MPVDATRAAYEAGKCELGELLGLEPAFYERLRAEAQRSLDGEEWQRALPLLQLLEILDRRDPKPTILTAEVLRIQGHAARAKTKLERVLEHPQVRLDALYAFAKAQLASLQISEAKTSLAEIERLDPDLRTDAAQRAHALVQQLQR